MLSWSVDETGNNVNLVAITDNSVDPILAGGRPLLDYVNAILSGDSVDEARDRVRDVISEAAAVDAAAITGNFDMMNRIADGVGMPVGRGTRSRMRGVIKGLGLDRFPHA
jgi:hypothetical protein